LLQLAENRDRLKASIASARWAILPVRTKG
jgi:hypothetical protein